MAERKVRYFIAAGRSAEIVEQLWKERDAGLAAAAALMREVGADNFYGNSHIAGFSFPERKLPNGWRWTNARNSPAFAKPRKDRKDLADLRARIEAVRYPDAGDLHKLLGFGMCITAEQSHTLGMIIRYVGAERIGGKVILKSPLNAEGHFGVPLDAIPIKHSEYWALREAEEETQP